MWGLLKPQHLRGYITISVTFIFPKYVGLLLF